MANRWRSVRLEDVAREVTVGHVGPMASEYISSGIPFLRSQNVTSLRIDLTDIKFISSDFHDRLRKSALEPGDVVIVRTGRPGACAVIPDSLPIANCSDLVVVRCGPELDPRFLAYYVNSAASHHVSSHLVGAVQQHFNVASARSLVLHLPSLSEQRDIVSILGTLDDKIELNRRMSETLEAMARALFKSWFVDFDPVRAKAEGRDTGLPKHIADQFPDTFEDFDLRTIPRGWEVKCVADLAQLSGGTTPSTTEPAFWDGGTHAWATPKDLSSLRAPVLLNTERRLTDSGLSQVSSGLLPPGTVLLSSRAPIGYLAIAGIPVAVNQGFVAMTPRAAASNLFLMFWAHFAHDEIISRANGSTFLEISRSSFRSIPVVTPPDVLMRLFDTQARGPYERIVQGEREATALVGLRDALLPRLMTGDLLVDNAEHPVPSTSRPATSP